MKPAIGATAPGPPTREMPQSAPGGPASRPAGRPGPVPHPGLRLLQRGQEGRQGAGVIDGLEGSGPGRCRRRRYGCPEVGRRSGPPRGSPRWNRGPGRRRRGRPGQGPPAPQGSGATCRGQGSARGGDGLAARRASRSASALVQHWYRAGSCSSPRTERARRRVSTGPAAAASRSGSRPCRSPSEPSAIAATGSHGRVGVTEGATECRAGRLLEALGFHLHRAGLGHPRQGEHGAAAGPRVAARRGPAATAPPRAHRPRTGPPRPPAERWCHPTWSRRRARGRLRVTRQGRLIGEQLDQLGHSRFDRLAAPARQGAGRLGACVGIVRAEPGEESPYARVQAHPRELLEHGCRGAGHQHAGRHQGQPPGQPLIRVVAIGRVLRRRGVAAFCRSVALRDGEALPSAVGLLGAPVPRQSW